MSGLRVTQDDLERMSPEDREKLLSGRAAEHSKLGDYKSPDYGKRFGSRRNGERERKR